MDKTEQGYRGDRREGFGAGRADRGAGRFGRGGGRFDRGAGRFDRGAGRFDRSVGRFDRGGGHFSWRRDGTNDYTNKSGTSDTSEAPRWDAATVAVERQSSSSGGVWLAKNKASADSGGGSSAHQPKDPALMMDVPSNSRAVAKSQVPSSNSDDLCPICKVAGHAAVRCSLAFCERCNKLGHLASVCIEFLPWECIAPMCVFQARGHGFFYIHDYCSAEQARERSCNVMITVLKGNPTVKQMNDAFFLYLGKTWRCSTKLVEPGVFFLRFPNIREVEKACYSDRITMKPCGTVVRATRWEQDDGAKGLLEKAWVKVGGIPTDKRCERNVAFVASLAGVLLEIDLASLHCPDSVRVKLGCRNINEIIPVAESVPGGSFL